MNRNGAKVEDFETKSKRGIRIWVLLCIFFSGVCARFEEEDGGCVCLVGLEMRSKGRKRTHTNCSGKFKKFMNRDKC